MTKTFNELVIGYFGYKRAFWAPKNNNIYMNITYLLFEQPDNAPGMYHERSVEEVADFITELFLIEFICMEVCGFDINKIDCKTVAPYCCTSGATAKEMVELMKRLKE